MLLKNLAKTDRALPLYEAKKNSNSYNKLPLVRMNL